MIIKIEYKDEDGHRQIVHLEGTGVIASVFDWRDNGDLEDMIINPPQIVTFGLTRNQTIQGVAALLYHIHEETGEALPLIANKALLLTRTFGASIIRSRLPGEEGS